MRQSHHSLDLFTTLVDFVLVFDTKIHKGLIDLFVLSIVSFGAEVDIFLYIVIHFIINGYYSHTAF